MYERHFQTVQNVRLLMERKVGLIPTMAPEFGRELERRQWENLASYPSHANIVVMKAFYTNAWSFGGATHGMYSSYVRGKRIPFDADTINSFLGAEWVGEQYITTHRAIFLYCVLRGLNINVGLVIANEIKKCAQAVRNKSPLGHPSLITQLCELAGVNTTTPRLERTRKEIYAFYYTQYCMLDEAGIPMPAPHHLRVHRRVPQQNQQGYTPRMLHPSK
ncbi:hypothetical protein LR48_Vigan09g076600 [Vigna angularis]|uniref:Putative plant transposon protein domain-containing protein n=1 Tax=Phaseolus angularis TaxID=3914 RepID=A0A0L9VB19_PHAAN|nr:hypothetical protein LR48_Vigan09g076600 [Vigna angularis]